MWEVTLANFLPIRDTNQNVFWDKEHPSLLPETRGTCVPRKDFQRSHVFLKIIYKQFRGQIHLGGTWLKKPHRMSLRQGCSESPLAVGSGRDSHRGIWRGSSWGPGHRSSAAKFLGHQCALVAQCFWRTPATPGLSLLLTPWCLRPQALCCGNPGLFISLVSKSRSHSLGTAVGTMGNCPDKPSDAVGQLSLSPH